MVRRASLGGESAPVTESRRRGHSTSFREGATSLSDPGASDALAELIEPAARLEELARGFAFVEGPLWHPDGYLLFTDIPGNTIHRWSASDGVSVVRSPSSKANGLAFDHKGRLLACEQVTSVITRTELDGAIGVLVSHWEGMELNSPNDVVVADDGAVWFTDPHPAGRTATWGSEREQELDFCGIYRFDPASASLSVVANDFRFPNGLCFSPDGSVLYANDTLGMTITAFDIDASGAVGARGELIRQGAELQVIDGRVVSSDPDPTGFDLGFPDGMKCDERGNVWCTGPGGVWVISPDGERLGVIETPEMAANLAWGGPSGTTLFITASSQLLRLETRVRGAAL